MPGNLKFRQLSGCYAVLRLAPSAATPAWATGGEFVSITRTHEELSIVCPVESVPPNLPYEPRWICLKLEGPFPFTQTGVLLSFIDPLSRNEVPIFAISTFDTDYVLIPQEHASRALDLLRAAGNLLIAA